MFEVEVKVRADHGPVRERLRDLDADRVGTVRQVDTYYAAPHRDFATTDEALRLREETDGEGTVHVLAYKGPKVDEASKTREEHETMVGDPAAMDAALRALGFDPAATVAKDRERYDVRGFTVSLDAVDDLGTFVEVERTVQSDRGPEADGTVDGATERLGSGPVEPVRDEALDLIEELGLESDAGIRTSYLGLLLDAEGG